MPKLSNKKNVDVSPPRSRCSEDSDTSSASPRSLKRPHKKQSAHFEVLRGLQDGQRYTKRPDDFQSELLLKTTFGYKKKVCLLTEGNLKVYRRSKHIPLGRIRFIVDLGLSVVSFHEITKCISVNADEEIYRFKVKHEESFRQWIENLRIHRLYKQDQFCYGAPSTRHDSMSLQELVPGIPLRGPQLEEFNKLNQLSEETRERRVLDWLNKNEDVECEEEDVPKLRTLFFELNSLLTELERFTDAATERKLSSEIGSPKPERKPKFRLSFRSKKGKESEENTPIDICGSTLKVPTIAGLSASNPEVNQVGINTFGSYTKGNSALQLKREFSDLYHRETYLKEEYLRVARDTYKGLGEFFQKLQHKDKLTNKMTKLDTTTSQPTTAFRTQSVPIVVNHYFTPTTENPVTDSAMYQTARDGYAFEINAKPMNNVNTLMPYSAHMKESSVSDRSDLESDFEFQDDIQSSEFNGTLQMNSLEQIAPFNNRCKINRDRLPVPMVETSFSIWSVLKQAIGKDLSKISFPVEMFEPLSMLQVLCEELEYSYLLDQSAQLIDPYMRMAYVSAFAVSRYASTITRAQRKPFNPLEGETYENYRDDLGWWFIAEQVSHHPAVSACHAKGRGWEFWQSASCNLVYWGKSIQAEPTSPVNISLENFQETYYWNKATSSVHNLFGGSRYVEHYGEVVVKCSSGISCKMYFKKSNGDNKHEIQGHIYDVGGHVKHILNGKWSQFLNVGNQTIWKANDFPSHVSEQYGFSNFAVTLNELNDDMKEYLPVTDSRFRPDQRCLEEGNLEEARKLKLELETNQRGRRKAQLYQSKWFDEETTNSQKQKSYKFNNRYWNARNQKFIHESFDLLWN